MSVHRALPAKNRTMVGAWCFLDHYGPDDVAVSGGMSVPRHPHTGLATVSWLFSGHIDHLDSAGNAAAVIPGEINLMIAGQGITHQEIMNAGTHILHGVQLWYALPESTRFSANHFENYAAPVVECEGLSALVFIGDLLGSSSPIDTRTPPLVGAELRFAPDSHHTIDLRSDFEYAVLAEDGPITINGTEIPHRALGFIPTGSTQLELGSSKHASRALLLGGEPFGESIVMWWNFIGRSHEEIEGYRARYQAEMGFEPNNNEQSPLPRLFGEFPPDTPAPLPAPEMPNVRLRHRR